MNALDPTRLLHTTVENRYKVLGVLGQGGMCTVYRAEDTKRSIQVALKVLPPERAADGEMAARFQREAAAGKRIGHPNVVSISDSGTLPDGSLYLVMELLDGSPLDELLEKGPLPVDKALSITRQMLAGLSAAHQLGMTHRDVKPDNVILVGDHVKLVDFGIASNDRAAFKLTALGLAFGTPEYISPEMAMGLAVDPRADLYSVGIVLYEMLTGKRPFEGDQKTLLLAHIDKKPPPPPGVPPKLSAFILRSLEKLPEKRHTSAEAMIAELDQLTPRPRRWWLFLLLAGLIAGLIWWFWMR
jgi:serine/threonine-protein kinase